MDPYLAIPFEEKFEAHPQCIVRAPGRVEILGNHTDYNEGFVLTAAIDRYIFMSGDRVESDQVTLCSQTMNDECTFSIHDLQHDPSHTWADYIKGVLDELQKAGNKLSGFRAMISSDLPLGGGVSSSAALESATATLMQTLFGFELSKPGMAKLCQRAENQFVGMPCGILDQMSSILGQEDSLLMLDCRTLDFELLKLKTPSPDIVICDTNVKHQLVQSEYKTRREQCFAAANTLSNLLKRDIPFLRDITADEFIPYLNQLPEDESCRAWHVVTENERVQQGKDAIKKEDTKGLGMLMYQSHESSRTLFENSCEELDILVEEARSLPGVIGAKLSGGGFGGCTVNLVEPNHTDKFCDEIEQRYANRANRACTTLICRIANGACVVSE